MILLRCQNSKNCCSRDNLQLMGLIEEHPKGPTLFLFGVGFFVERIMHEHQDFYNSTAWKRCRDSYRESVGGLCEQCLAEGRYTPAEIVHHIIPIDDKTVNDPSIALSWSNMRALCRECHAAAHGARQRRYKVDELGRVVATR